MPRKNEPGPLHGGAETRFLRRFAGPTRLACIGMMVTLVPIMVYVPFVFAGDGRLGWTVASALIALTTIVMLLMLPLLGYRIDADGIASRQGIPPRFTDTMAWDEIAMITWMAGPIRGLVDNCTVWTSGDAKPVRVRSLYDAQTALAARAEVAQYEAQHGTLTPMLITLSSLSRANRKRLLSAFEQHGFEPLPEGRGEYNSIVSRPADHQASRG